MYVVQKTPARLMNKILDEKHKQIELPDVVVRSRRRVNNASVIVVIVWFGLMLYGLFSGCLSIINTVLMMAAMLPFMVLVGLWLFWADRRHDIAATQAYFALCLHCEFDLTGLDQIGNCPSCGTAYDLEEVRACWQRWRPIWSGPKHKNSEALCGKLKHVVLPNAVARDRRRIQICYFLLMLTMFGAYVYFPLHSRYMLAMFVTYIILALIGLVTFWFRRRERHLKKAAQQADYALCLHCQYDLTGLGKQQHKCPECGTQYDLEYVRACWWNWRTMREEAMGGK